MYFLNCGVKLAWSRGEKCQKSVKEVSTVVKSHEIVCYLQPL